eukprot:6883398-Lingulodinium_polyedra.AAC.1
MCSQHGCMHAHGSHGNNDLCKTLGQTSCIAREMWTLECTRAYCKPTDHPQLTLERGGAYRPGMSICGTVMSQCVQLVVPLHSLSRVQYWGMMLCSSGHCQ